MNTRIRQRSLAAIGFTFAATLLLTSCANPLDKLVETVTSSAADGLVSEMTGVDVDGVGSTSVPEDFPKNVALPDLTPSSAMATTIDGSRNWLLHYKDGATDEVYEELFAKLAAADFAEDSSSDMSGVMRIAVFKSPEYIVNIGLLGSQDRGQILQVSVARLASN